MVDSEDYLSFKKEFIIGHKEIDSEHEKLFDIAKKVSAIKEMNSEEEKKEFFSKLLDELNFYVNTHFENEENYMREIRYKSYNSHKNMHKKLLEILQFITLNLPLISVTQTQCEFENFMKNTFVEHIIKEDVKLLK